MPTERLVLASGVELHSPPADAVRHLGLAFNVETDADRGAGIHFHSAITL